MFSAQVDYAGPENQKPLEKINILLNLTDPIRVEYNDKNQMSRTYFYSPMKNIRNNYVDFVVDMQKTTSQYSEWYRFSVHYTVCVTEVPSPSSGYRYFSGEGCRVKYNRCTGCLVQRKYILNMIPTFVFIICLIAIVVCIISFQYLKYQATADRFVEPAITLNVLCSAKNVCYSCLTQSN